METGKIVQILGPVIDVAFTGKLPMIKDALTVQMEHKKCVMEVAQHMGNGVVRCISLSATDGLGKGYGSHCNWQLYSSSSRRRNTGQNVQCFGRTD